MRGMRRERVNYDAYVPSEYRQIYLRFGMRPTPHDPKTGKGPDSVKIALIDDRLVTQ